MSKRNEKTFDLKTEIARVHKQHRVSFFLGVAAVTGWDLDYESVDLLSEQTRSLAECLDLVDVMKAARPNEIVSSALSFIGRKREREATAARVGK